MLTKSMSRFWFVIIVGCAPGLEGLRWVAGGVRTLAFQYSQPWEIETDGYGVAHTLHQSRFSMDSTNVGHYADESDEIIGFTPTTTTSIPTISFFDLAYESGTATWVIGKPQPEIIALERDGWIRGTVLDIGCGTGEHTIHLARLGYEVRGIDSSRSAIKRSRENAAEHNVTASFQVADALRLRADACFDTIIDSALFHEFGLEERTEYVRSLHAACRPGAFVHVLAMSDTGPRFGPQISDTVILEAFATGWIVEELRESRYSVIVDADASVLHGIPEGGIVEAGAWLARVRRKGMRDRPLPRSGASIDSV